MPFGVVKYYRSGCTLKLSIHLVCTALYMVSGGSIGLLSDHVVVTLIRSEVQPASTVRPINPLHECGCQTHPIMRGTMNSM